MRKIFQVFRWEFVTHFRSRTFMISTLFSPILLSTIILFPTLFIEEQDKSAEIIGVVDFSEINIIQKLSRELNSRYSLENLSPKYYLVTIQFDSSEDFLEYHSVLVEMERKKDSLNIEYQKVIKRREAIFRTPRTSTRAQKLKTSYNEMVYLNELKQLSEFDLELYREKLDSLYQVKVLEIADQRLLAHQVDAYIVIPKNILSTGDFEYHSLYIGDRTSLNAINSVLSNIIVNERMESDRISPSLRDKWLGELKPEIIQLSKSGKREFNYYVNYFGPIIVVFLLFIAIFTSSGFLFSGILQEKTSKIVEILVSSLTPGQLMAGKILGLGSLGLVQVAVWMGLTFLMILVKAVNTEQLAFINTDNALLFALYFILGYFFFAAVYVGIAALFRSEKDAQQVNTFLRIIAIFPVLMAILVLNDPRSGLVQGLSFVPFLTPTFMILRISLSMPATLDIIVSIAVMIISIILAIYIAGRIFRVGILYDGDFPGFKTIVKWIRRENYVEPEEQREES